MSQPKNTALHSSHIDLGAKMVNFAQWEMPITYSSLMEEHHAVRKTAGIFDAVSYTHLTLPTTPYV